MECPKCEKGNVYVANTYTDGKQTTTQRRICADCGAVITTLTTTVNVDPPRGQGAFALSKKFKNKNARLLIEDGHGETG